MSQTRAKYANCNEPIRMHGLGTEPRTYKRKLSQRRKFQQLLNFGICEWPIMWPVPERK